jgi:glyoxylase-like metal-dependent hydrolase (beta-lactamase superfamily II)
MPLLLAALLAVAAAPVEDLGHDTLLLRGEFVSGRQPDGNSVLLRGPQGWVLVDSGRHAEHTQRLLDRIEASGVPLRAVVNTHWHLDHVSGNVLLREKYPDAEVLASDAIDEALSGFLADYRKQLQTMLSQPPSEAEAAAWRAEIARIDAGARLRPTRVVAQAGEIELAGRSLQLGLADHAATAGDVWLYDPVAKLLVAGDLVTLPAPFLDTACAPRWGRTLGELEAIDFARLVPGHGAPMTRAQFAIYHSAFDGLLACAASSEPPSECAQHWVQEAAPLLRGEDPKWVAGMVEYYVQQRLRGEARDKDCPASASTGG